MTSKKKKNMENYRNGRQCHYFHGFDMSGGVIMGNFFVDFCSCFKPFRTVWRGLISLVKLIIFTDGRYPPTPLVRGKEFTIRSNLQTRLYLAVMNRRVGLITTNSPVLLFCKLHIYIQCHTVIDLGVCNWNSRTLKYRNLISPFVWFGLLSVKQYPNY